ncbi:MAG: hypothetical protein KJ066_01865 [Acidobacteria bacterium]|nr:hypothetical protein [Acidobacteriota bacterium]
MSRGSGRALRALLAGIVDYAGLFPPAGLDMAGAVEQYARHRREAAAWMLGRFVVPVARLDELVATAAAQWSTRDEGPRWRIAALGGGEPAADVERIRTFNVRHGTHAVVDAFEVKVTTAADVAALGAAAPPALALACELPLTGPFDSLLAAARAAGAGVKFRTGGLTADAFPSSAVLADAVAGTLLAGVAFKATAGLHHPVRREARTSAAPDSPIVPMHGFVNLFAGAALAHATLAAAGGDGLGAAGRERLVSRLVAMLDERDPAAFLDTGEALAWRGGRIGIAEITAARRDFALSFGSCSFDEPVDELTALGFTL